MTSDELFDAAHPFPFLSLRDKLEDRPFIIIAPQPDDESLTGGLPTGTKGESGHRE
jgi:hypothetical protein